MLAGPNFHFKNEASWARGETDENRFGFRIATAFRVKEAPEKAVSMQK